MLTLAIGCAIIIRMKGPAYVADAYEVPHREQPGGELADGAAREGERATFGMIPLCHTCPAAALERAETQAPKF